MLTATSQEDLFAFFSAFGLPAFCDAHSVRPTVGPGRGGGRGRGGSSEAAGYAFVGFAGAGGSAVAARLLQEPVHLFKGAEIRIKVWRSQRSNSGSGGALPYPSGGGAYPSGNGGRENSDSTFSFDPAELEHLAGSFRAMGVPPGPAPPPPRLGSSIWAGGAGQQPPTPMPGFGGGLPGVWGGQ